MKVVPKSIAMMKSADVWEGVTPEVVIVVRIGDVSLLRGYVLNVLQGYYGPGGVRNL